MKKEEAARLPALLPKSDSAGTDDRPGREVEEEEEEKEEEDNGKEAP